jgi:hypothetical protein
MPQGHSELWDALRALVLIFIGPLVVQVATYFALARFAFRVPTALAAAIAIVRVVIGMILFWGLVLLNLGDPDPVREYLVISSPIAWGVAALIDPRRSILRGAAWVLVGTALTFGVNELYWRLLMGESMLDADTRWSFG